MAKRNRDTEQHRHRDMDLVHAFLVRPALLSLLALQVSGRCGRTALVASERGALYDANARMAATHGR